MTLTPKAIERIAWAIFDAHRNRDAVLTYKAGSFVGQTIAEPDHDLSEKQMAWFLKLAERAGVPLDDEGSAA